MNKKSIAKRALSEADRVVKEAQSKVTKATDPISKGRYAADLRSAKAMRRGLRSTLSR